MSMRLCLILLAACLLVLPGCGGEKRPDGMPATTPVTITIMQDGAPLEGALVGFLSSDTVNSNWSAGGTTDSSGKAKMKTHSLYDGVVPGKYKVTVKKTRAEPLPDWYGEVSEEKRLAYKPPPPEVFVHTKFGNMNTTPLEVEVGGSPVNETFEVEKP